MAVKNQRVSKEFVEVIDDVKRQVKEQLGVDLTGSQASKIIAAKVKGINLVGVRRKRKFDQVFIR